MYSPTNPFSSGTLSSSRDVTSKAGKSASAGKVSVHKSKKEVLHGPSKCLSDEKVTVSTEMSTVNITASAGQGIVDWTQPGKSKEEAPP